MLALACTTNYVWVFTSKAIFSCQFNLPIWERDIKRGDRTERKTLIRRKSLVFQSQRALVSETDGRASVLRIVFSPVSQTEVRGCCVLLSKLKSSSGMAHANCSVECVKFIEGCYCKTART